MLTDKDGFILLLMKVFRQAMLFCCALLFTQQATAESMRICYENQSYHPFLSGSDLTPQENPGILLELIQQAAAQNGINATFYRRPWKRCIADVTDGTSDGLFAAIWTPERESWAVFPKTSEGVDSSKGLWHVRYPVFVQSGTALNYDGIRFTGVINGLSAPLGYVAYQKLSDMKVLAEGSFDIEKGLKLVSLGRLDGYVAEHFIGSATVASAGFGEYITQLPEPFLVTDWYLPVSRQYYWQHADLTEAFWSSLKQEREQSANVLLVKYAVVP